MAFGQLFQRKELLPEQALAKIGILRTKITLEAKEFGIAGSKKDDVPEYTLWTIAAARRRFTKMKDTIENYDSKFTATQMADALQHFEKAKDAIEKIKAVDEPARMKNKAIRLAAGPVLMVIGFAAAAAAPVLFLPGAIITLAGCIHTSISNYQAHNARMRRMGFARLQELKEMAKKQPEAVLQISK